MTKRIFEGAEHDCSRHVSGPFVMLVRPLLRKSPKGFLLRPLVSSLVSVNMPHIYRKQPEHSTSAAGNR